MFDYRVYFSVKLSEKTGHDVRLPTEAEWEYACRAGTTTEWFFGDDPAKFGDYAWFKDNDGGTSHPVGQKKPNPWGLHDIFGNVLERVSDRYAKEYSAKSPAEDPTGPQLGKNSCREYEIEVSQAGTYSLTARAVTLRLAQGTNILRFSRTDPPQYGVAIKSFTLRPVREGSGPPRPASLGAEPQLFFYQELCHADSHRPLPHGLSRVGRVRPAGRPTPRSRRKAGRHDEAGQGVHSDGAVEHARCRQDRRCRQGGYA